MKRLLATVVLGAMMFLPAPGAAQVGVAARVGTLGIGGELALGLSDQVVLRGGAGFSRLVASTTFDGVAVDVDLPEAFYNVGLDFYLNGAFRIGGGVMYRPDDLVITGTFDGPVDVGGTTLTPEEIGTLTGLVASRKRAGYAVMGFGKHVTPGVGLALDVGAAFMGSPTVSLSAQGGTYPAGQLADLLATESAGFERDMKTYLKVWPILSLGLRVGVGG